MRVRSKSLRGLLATHVAIAEELRRRGFTRTGAALGAELSERIALEALGGELVPPGRRSIDLIDGQGRRVQVKHRSLPRGVQRPMPFSDLDFDVAICLRFDRATFDLEWARELTADEARAVATPHATDVWRITTARAAKAGRDVTVAFRDAYASLDALV